MNEVRSRLTERLTAARLRLETRRAARPLAIYAVAAAVALMGAGFLFVKINGSILQGKYTATFAVDDAFGIVPGLADVRYRGVPAGRVTKVERSGIQVVLEAEIDAEYGPIYRDARVELRPVTPLQDVYLDIVDPGTPATGELAGNTLPEGQSRAAIRVDDVLDGFRGRERARLQTLLDQLGHGLEDNGVALRRSFVALAPLLANAGRVTSELAARRQHTRRLVHNVATLTGELGRRQTQLRRLVTAGSVAVGTLQAGSADLDTTLRELPSTVREIRASTTTLRPVLDAVDPALTSLYPAADKLEPALAALSDVAGDLQPAAQALQDPVRRLAPFAAAVQPAATRLRQIVDDVEPNVGTVHKVADVMVKCETGFIGFFQWNVSMSKFGDLHGRFPRGSLTTALPDTGSPVAVRPTPESCIGGAPIRGRPATQEDHK